MTILCSVLLLLLGFNAAQALYYRALWQFRRMIICTMPTSCPFLNYGNYGCYCGWGGSGTPVDDLDRCCQVHDNCYAEALKHKACWPVFDNPYTEIYAYSCDRTTKKITCKKNNTVCEMFICECDRKAADCFAVSKYNQEHKRLPKSHCEKK
ncbi:phospholipase A2-like [Clarias gariepinus]|uniref:phospholipase A2-like n=1 Tax=Clarias gariepinus TaxID=13013 RepID=UPI00234DC672|nr:phospholipase A2-like [Clarias gariepinus]